MPPVTSTQAPADDDFPVLPDLTHYLNHHLALEPPLRVNGQPPLLQIHLPAAHLAAPDNVLPRLEQALRDWPGAQSWDLQVWVEEADDTSRWLHQARLDPATPPPAIALPELPPPATAATAAPSVTADAPTPTAPTPPRTTWQQRVQARQRGHRQRRQIAAVVVVTGASFILGTLTAVGIEWARSRSTPFAAVATETVAPPLEPAIAETPAGTDSDPAMTVDAPAEPPSLSTHSLIAPITAVGGLNISASSLTVPPTAQVAVQLKAVGDVIPGTDFPDYRLPRDPNYLFNSVKMFMGEVDLVFGNFESTLTDYPYTAKNIGQGMTFAFRTPPAWTDVLKSAGFDVLSVANNHSFDFGDRGFDDTIAHIQQSGMHAVGRKGEIVNVEANGYTVAFIGFSYWPDHNDMNDLPTATALVQQAQAQADLVVISVHAGAEGTGALRVRNQTEYFFSENRGNMVQFSRAMIDAGADLVLGHGPHVPRALELYQDKLIAYSLGNFLGYRTLSTVGPLGLSMILQVDLAETGDFLQGRVIPVALDQNGVPYIDNGFASVTLMRQLTQQDFPETPIAIDDMGYILRTDGR